MLNEGLGEEQFVGNLRRHGEAAAFGAKPLDVFGVFGLRWQVFHLIVIVAND